MINMYQNIYHNILWVIYVDIHDAARTSRLAYPNSLICTQCCYLMTAMMVERWTLAFWDQLLLGASLHQECVCKFSGIGGLSVQQTSNELSSQTAIGLMSNLLQGSHWQSCSGFWFVLFKLQLQILTFPQHGNPPPKLESSFSTSMFSNSHLFCFDLVYFYS